MDWNPQTLQSLSQLFLDTLSPTSEVRRRAEEDLLAAADTPGYGVGVLQVVDETASSQQIRECASVWFTKHVKTRWMPLPTTPIPDGEKEQIKTIIVPLILRTTGKVQAELTEAIAVIGNHDFSKFWPGLLPDLTSRLEMAMNGNDFVLVNGILATINSLFKRFRCESSCTVKSDLEYCSGMLAERLWKTAEGISRKMNACVSSQLLEARRLCCRIFYSLNYMGVAGELKDKEEEWMNEFKNYLTERSPDLEDCKCVDEVRVAVCDIICHYMEKEREVLEKHLTYFIEAVWSLVAAESSSERMGMGGMKFLRKCVDHGDYVEFIKRDMDGNNGLCIRRRNDCELLKGQNNKEKIRARIFHWLALWDENPAANWEYKECAIYMVVSLATDGRSDVVDVESFFTKYIIPEIEGKDVNAFPMLKAVALKFFTVFRYLIPTHIAMPLLDELVRYVGSDWRVVHTCAAICIEKLLLDGVVKLKDHTLTLSLVGALKKDPLCQMNQYIMRCMARVLERADKDPSWRVTCWVFDALKEAHPRDHPMFNHFLFEAVAALIRLEVSLEGSHSVLSLLNLIFPITIQMLGRNARLFYPYMFQLLAQLVDLNRHQVPFPRAYMEVFDKMILGYDLILWKQESAVAVCALARLVESFLQEGPDEVKNEGRLKHVMDGIIKKLVSSPDTEEEGFRLLNTVIEKYEYGVIEEYMNDIWASLFARLENESNKTPTLVRGVMVFMSLFLVKHGVQTLVDLVNSVSAAGVDLFHHAILPRFWIPNLKTITGYMEVKLCAVASTKLLCESVSLLDLEAEDLWGELLDALVPLLSQRVYEERKKVNGDADLSGYLLQKAVAEKQKDWDPFKEMEFEDPKQFLEIKDPKQFLVAFPAKLSADDFTGKFPLTIMRHLSHPHQAALVKLCNFYSVKIA